MMVNIIAFLIIVVGTNWLCSYLETNPRSIFFSVFSRVERYTCFLRPWKTSIIHMSWICTFPLLITFCGNKRTLYSFPHYLLGWTLGMDKQISLHPWSRLRPDKGVEWRAVKRSHVLTYHQLICCLGPR